MRKTIFIFILIIFAAWFTKEVFFVSYTVAKKSANELRALANCKIIYEACKTYQQANRDYPENLRVLGLEKPPYLPKGLAKGLESGYRYSYEKTQKGFFVYATPVKMGQTGRFDFSIDQSGRIYVCDKDRHCMTETEYLNVREAIRRNDLYAR